MVPLPISTHPTSSLPQVTVFLLCRDFSGQGEPKMANRQLHPVGNVGCDRDQTPEECIACQTL